MQTIIARHPTLLCLCILACVSIDTAHSENTPEQDRQQLEQMLEMMKNSGVDPSQLEGIENMLRGGVETEIQAKIAAERAEFDEYFGTETNATLEINGHRYDLVVTECEWIDKKTESFGIAAEQPPGEDGATLVIDGGGRQGMEKIYFMTPSGEIDGESADLTFDGQRFAWSGPIYDMIVNISVSCE